MGWGFLLYIVTILMTLFCPLLGWLSANAMDRCPVDFGERACEIMSGDDVVLEKKVGATRYI